MDRRKFNGGNSTKAKGIDKRKNEYKDVLNDTLTQDDLKKVILMLHRKSINEDDTNAAKLILEYYIGKPQQRVDVTTDGESFNVPVTEFFGK